MTNNQTKNIKEMFINKFDKIKESFSTPIKRTITIRKIMGFIVNIFKYIFLYGLCFIVVYPIILQLAVAFRDPTDVNNVTALWIPGIFSVKNFEISSKALMYWSSIRNTFLLSLGVMVCQIISTALAGYAFARLKFKGRTVCFVLAMFTIIVPQTVISFPLKQAMISSNLIGKPWALFLMSILGMGIKSGIFIYIFRQFFKGIPTELEEAAYVDGANAFQVFQKVMLPNALGGILIVGILSFVWQWNDYFYTNLFVDPNSFKTISVAQQSVLVGLQQSLADSGVWTMLGTDITNNSLFSSMIVNTCGIIAMLPLLIMYLFVQNLFIEGIERSGIVG